jgi:integrase
MKLTDLACKSAKTKEKAYRLFDGGGLYLEVTPNGSKCWRLKYRYNLKEKRLSFGTYPFVSLAEARTGRDDAKKQLLKGIDPSEAKKAVKRQAILDSENTFKVIALEWFDKKKGEWNAKYARNKERSLEKDILPHLGRLNINAIKSIDVLDTLRKVEERDALDLAGRARQTIGQIFRYAIQTGRCEHDPTINLRGALKTRKVEHFAAITANEIPHLINALDLNKPRLYHRTIRAIRLSMLTFIRPGEIRQSLITEFDLKKSEWRIPAERMKGKVEHIVPLSEKAVAIIQEQMTELENLSTEFLFPSQINLKKPMSDGTVNKALHKLGFKNKMTAHGFRALARTTIREELDYEPDIIEAQLAHKPMGALGAAYDRAKFLKKRKLMMKDWADLIEKIVLEHKKKELEEQFKTIVNF